MQEGQCSQRACSKYYTTLPNPPIRHIGTLHRYEKTRQNQTCRGAPRIHNTMSRCAYTPPRRAVHTGYGRDSWVPRQSETLRVPPNGGPLLRLTCGLDGGNVWPSRVVPVKTRGQSEPSGAIRRNRKARAAVLLLGGWSWKDPQPKAAPGSCKTKCLRQNVFIIHMRWRLASCSIFNVEGNVRSPPSTLP